MNGKWMLPEKYGRLLDSLTSGKIILGGLVFVLLLGLFFMSFLFIPLQCGSEDYTELKYSLLRQADTLEKERLDRERARVKSADLPQIAGFIGDCFRARNLTVQEILIPQYGQESSADSQAVIQLTVAGSRSNIFQALAEILQDEGYPLLLQHIDSNQDKATIYMKVKLQST